MNIGPPHVSSDVAVSLAAAGVLVSSGGCESKRRLCTVGRGAAYDTLHMRCNDKVGAAKAVRTKAVQMARFKAQADQRLSSRDCDARRDVAELRRDVEYMLAAEKSDLLAATPRGACLVKARAGKR